MRRLRGRLAAMFADMPILFFAVVLGVALTFKVAIGWARSETVEPEPARAARPTTSAASASPATTIAVAPEPGIAPATATATPSAKPPHKKRRFAH